MKDHITYIGGNPQEVIIPKDVWHKVRFAFKEVDKYLEKSDDMKYNTLHLISKAEALRIAANEIEDKDRTITIYRDALNILNKWENIE